MSKFFKKAALIVVGAAAFGGVSGGVFNLVVGDRVYYESTEEAGEDARDYDKKDKTTAENGDSASHADITQSEGIINTTSGFGVTEIVNETMPSVVAITIKSVQEYEGWFFGNSYQYEQEGSGSGIIVGKNDTELLIVTNNHVVEGATSVTVGFIDGSACEAKVKGMNADNDVAVVAVSLDDLDKETVEQIKIAKIGDSDKLAVGEQVVAIGNALGYGQSVTTGIVSAKDRTNSTNVTPLIQTDAAINPGNSGGALINMNGEIVGINSSKYADTDVEGMGYAIPINAVHDIIDELGERAIREKVDEDKAGFLGVETQTIDSQTSQYYGFPVGAYIRNVTENSPADKAGLKAKSVIVKFDKTSVTSAEGLVEMLEYYEAGEKVEVVCKVLEGDEYVEKTYMVTLERRKSYIDDDTSSSSGNSRPGNDNKQDGDKQEEPSNGSGIPEDFFDNFFK